jgi:4-amino-4-deoxy-L-arabinose transferase-like glycosyltransferase
MFQFISSKKKAKLSEQNKVSTKEITKVLSVALIYLIGLILWANSNGALGIPRNDDAFYLRTAFHFAKSGNFVPISAYPTLIGQTIISAPVIKIFGENIAALQTFCAFLGVTGLVFIYLLFRDFLVWYHSTICVAVLALGPIFSNLSISYMTDIPAFAFQAAGIFLLSRSLVAKSKNLFWLIGSFLATATAFTIRQTTISTVAVILVVLFIYRDRHIFKARVIVPIAVLFCVSLVFFYTWRASLAEFQNFPVDTEKFHNPAYLVVSSVLSLGMTYGIYLFPIVLLINPIALLKSFKKCEIYAALIGGFAICYVFLQVRPKPNGNYFSQFVPVQAAVKASSHDLLYGWEWQLIQVVGLVCTGYFLIVSGLWCRRKFANPKKLTESFVVASVSLFSLGGLLVGAFGGAGFDRYGFLVIPLSAALLLRLSDELDVLFRYNHWKSLAWCALVLVYGARAFDASTRYDGGAWRIAEQLTKRGADPLSIDGGYPWFAFYQSDVDNLEIDKFALWFKFSEDQSLTTQNEEAIINKICYVSRVYGTDPGDQKVSELNVSGLFGWKAHFELHKRAEC